MVTCLICGNILTIMNVSKNVKEPGRCTTEFECNRCKAQMRVIQLVIKNPKELTVHGR